MTSSKPTDFIDPATYGDNCAAFYDEIYGPPQAVVVNILCAWAGAGTVLELGLATGRTALALSKRGLTVAGIEASTAMLEQFRSKAGSEAIRVVEGDFATIQLAEQFDLVFALVNTFCLLETQQRQGQCLQNVAEMLKDDGSLVMEMSRPSGNDQQRTADGLRAYWRHELQTRHGKSFYETHLLYPEVEVLDALAWNAGLVLKRRLGSWRGTPYDPNVGNHISFYAKRV